MAKQKFERFQTPIGTAVFPHLTEADRKFDQKGVYHTKLAIPAEDAQELVDQLEAARDRYAEEVRSEKAKYKRYKLADVCEDEVDDEGNDTGRLIFKFKRPASFEKDGEVKRINPPAIFDAANNPLDSVDLWGGSEIIIAGHIRPYAMDSTKQIGVSLRVDGVQILNLVTGGARTAEDFGFEQREGYEAPSVENTQPETSDVGDDEGDDKGDEEEF